MVFSVTTTLVQIDAVVTDSKGRYVTDLAPSDFEVFEDGKPQPITNFSYVQIPGPRHPPAEPRPRPKPHRTLPPAPAAPLRPDDVRRTIVLMVDDLGLSFESMAQVRGSLRKFVDNQVQPGDLVAICRTGSGSSGLHQFTTDKRILLAAVDALRWNPNGRFGTSLFTPIGMYGSTGGPEPSGDFRSRDFSFETERNAVFTVGTLGAVSSVVAALRDMPGRKSIVLFSDGISLQSAGDLPQMHTSAGTTPVTASNAEILESLRKLIDRANRAGTVIYTIQASGLQTLQADAADNPQLGATPAFGAQEQMAALNGITQVGSLGGRDVLFNIGQQGLAYLAYQTGGVPYQNGNDINWGLERVLEDQRGYYLLGYKPPESTFRDRNGRRDFHRIKVRVKRRGLLVRTRTGFFGQTDEETRPRYDSPLAQMRAAMLSPFQSSGIHLRLTALYAPTPDKGALVRNLVYIDPADLHLAVEADGSRSAKLDVIAVATGSADSPLASLAQSFQVQVPAAGLDRLLSEGALYAMNVPIPKPGAYQIRVAVRDQATGRIGSASQFLEIPDLKKRAFALTSVVLEDGDRPAGAPGLLGIVPARRQFHRGARLEYLCFVQNGASKPANTVVATIRILRGDKQIFTAPAPVVDVSGTSAITGMLRLTEGMAPGEYYIEVVAETQGVKKPALDGQWTDFEVVP